MSTAWLEQAHGLGRHLHAPSTTLLRFGARLCWPLKTATYERLLTVTREHLEEPGFQSCPSAGVKHPDTPPSTQLTGGEQHRPNHPGSPAGLK